jgi:ankyrin repeat protein
MEPYPPGTPGARPKRPWFSILAAISILYSVCGLALSARYLPPADPYNLLEVLAQGFILLIGLVLWFPAFALAAIAAALSKARKRRLALPLLALLLSIATPLFCWQWFARRPTQTGLVRAIERGDEAMVRQALRFRLPLDEFETHTEFTTIHGHTPLTAAAASGQRDIAKLLLDRGASVKAPNGSGYLPLSHAAMRGHTEIAELLLVRGADPNAKNRDRTTPLYHAAEYGNVEVARRLLAWRADPNLRAGPADSTPLEVALNQVIPRGDPLAVAMALAAHGADLGMRDARGRTPIEVAASRGNAALVAALKPALKEGSSPRDHFFVALAAGDETQALALLDQDPRLAGPYADRVIFAAVVQARMLNLTRVFLERGSRGEAVLNVAAATGDEKLVELVAGGEKRNWEWLLHEAARIGRLDVVKMALAHDADVNAISNRRSQITETALHVAAQAGSLDVIEHLVARGADVNALGSAGTPVDVAVVHHKAKALRILVKHGGKAKRYPGNKQVLLEAGIVTDAEWLRVFGGVK